ncbi:hypothetical protein [Nostoc sp.]|uniref:hypothetical protein n=1 Tax=Nostoc sp. TaxID=1180 RepID=UPI002FF625A8
MNQVRAIAEVRQFPLINLPLPLVSTPFSTKGCANSSAQGKSLNQLRNRELSEAMH